jgi:hypothetical protein
MAAWNGTLADVKAFLEGLGDEEKKSKLAELGGFGQSTPLHMALNRDVTGTPEERAKKAADKTEIIQYLVNSGAPIDALNGSKRTPLQLASASGDRLSLELLIELGADQTLTANNQTIEDMAKGAAADYFRDKRTRVEHKGVTEVFKDRAKQGKQSPEDLERLTQSFLGTLQPKTAGKRKTRARKTRARKTKRRLTRRRK